MSSARGRVWFTLAVLFGINTMNFFDRQILSAIQEPIRKEWNLTDSELGWLGTAFIVLYAFVGLPLGRLADVWRRKWVLAVGCGVWSLLTAGSGVAWNFWSLFAMRLGVGVGEASCAPTSSSLIGDLFPPERRARAMSLFMLGLPIGLGLSFLVSGWMAEHFGWRNAFYIAGIPGLLLAFAALFVLDPARGSADKHILGQKKSDEHVGQLPPSGETAPPEAPLSAAEVHLPVGVVVRRILSLPTMWWIIISGALHNFNMYALGHFIASLLIRYHGSSVAEAGRFSGIACGLGAVGVFLSGWLGDWALKHGVRGRLQVGWVALALAVPCLLMALAAPPGKAVLFTAWLLPAYTMLYFYYGTVYPSIQDIIEPRLRGMAMAIYFFAMYILGAMFGPVATGWISDTFAARAAREAGVEPTITETGKVMVSEQFRATGLHQAMYVVPVLCAVLVLILFAASLTITRDRQRLLERSAA